MNARTRIVVLLVAVLVLGGVAVGSVLRAADQAQRKDQQQTTGPQVTAGRVALAGAASARQPRLVFRSTLWGPHRDELVSVPASAPAGPRTASGLRCLRFFTAAGTGSCLRAVPGALAGHYEAVVLDARLRARRHVPLVGSPTRTRVSPSGRMVAWTVFVSGESYTGLNFSTRTSILDTRTGTFQSNLESYRVVKDGQPYRSPDINFWGVTFADDGHFYATMATRGTAYLVRGDIARRTVTTLRGNVECPSLSPDGTRLAFKKRVPGLPADAPWRLYVLDLPSMREHPLAERRSADDQAVWLDDHTVAYALPGDFETDAWSVPSDGTGHPHRLMPAAQAPSEVR
ncbi:MULTISPECIES: PD40 domain-containing protein [Streptomyces]|uniref:PD40 domain-containing protein n=1 Tax=Streptomyces siderophoricus TaxID=2802281 RepID=A0ABS1MQM8_9ACTN|nr:PD40 domain-containing protein [Streptomyces sp. 9-7]MBL1090033.1 PD40 domain-containing protein [Streptomyces sp. 9-7]